MTLSEILKNLNPKQLQAVTQIDGPVMVVAGPGTGKTQILSARIAQILDKTDTQPSQILCLTYTEAGTRAMHKRLEQMIGPTAHKVPIHTFHSLGAEIIRDHESLFGMRGLQPISDLEKEQVLREIIDQLDPNNPILLKTKDPYYYNYTLKQLFGLMKSENLSAAELKHAIQDYLSQIRDMERYQYQRNMPKFNIQKGDPKEAEITKVTEAFAKLSAGLNLFEVYESKLKSMGRYDFDDMLLWVIRELEHNAELLMQYRERYEYFLVDEFQDTNGAQAHLLYLLSDYWEKPNLFVVGDDDQSIYKFQGANVSNIINFASQYQNHLKTVVLTNNYRSLQPILDASTALINHNQERLVNSLQIEKHLEAARSGTQDLPQIRSFNSSEEEAAYVCSQIQSILTQARPHAPADIAIIYRKHKQAEPLMHFMNQLGIPFYAVKSVNVLSEPIISQVVTLLKYFASELQQPYSGSPELFRILHYKFWGLEPIVLAQLTYYAGRNRLTLREMIHKPDSTFEEAGITDSGAILNVKKTIQTLEDLISDAASYTVPMLVERVIQKTGILSYAIQAQDKSWQIQLLNTFFDFVKEETSKNPDITLHNLIYTIGLHNDLAIPIEVNQVIGTETGVQFVTAHSSKGLEYEHVFMIGCDDKNWKPQKNRVPFKLHLILENEEDDKAYEEEARRLFFVGMTRAKSYLTISFASDKAKESRYVSELRNSQTAVFQETVVPPELLTQLMIAQIQEPPERTFEVAEQHWLSHFIHNYSLSVTHLNQYLHCPVSFYYDKVLRVPTAKNRNMAFGTAVHNSIDSWLSAATQASDKSFALPPVTVLVDEFENQMKREKGAFTPVEFKRFKALGKQVLSVFAERKRPEVENLQSYLTEKSLQGEFMGTMLNGKADLVQIYGKEAILIDFKTGKPANSKSKLIPPDWNATEADTFEKRFGGDYWRQIAFYNLLCDIDPQFTWSMKAGSIEYIEAEEESDRVQKLVITPEELTFLKNQVIEVNNQIKNAQFKKGCGECEWCLFESEMLEGRNYRFEALSARKDYEES